MTSVMIDRDRLFQQIETLVMCHSPSGVEDEVDAYLLQQFAALGLNPWQDAAGNVIALVPGQDSGRAIAITAHKDEIGGIVKTINAQGQVRVGKLGGAFPWVYGEGVVDLLGDRQTVSGILSFGSRHVSHESPQKVFQEDQSIRWQDAWVETKRTPEELAAAGVQPGTRMVIGKHRKRPFRLHNHIASYTLDNKASLAILLELGAMLDHPPVDVYLVASAKEEVGAIGALYFTQHFTQSLSQRLWQSLPEEPIPRNTLEAIARQISQTQTLEALVALEICPLSMEYPVEDGPAPVLLVQDGYGIYDPALNRDLQQAAIATHIPLQLAALSGFGSDASIAMKNGHVARAACLSFPTENTHGYEIAHLDAIAHCVTLLQRYCEDRAYHPPPSP
jgi:putative aminopeptidase FrvX